MKILIVDDSKLMRRIISNVINHHYNDIEIKNADDGTIALDMIDQETFDIVLLDWNMPLLTGDEVVKQIRAQKKHNHLRIMMITTESSKEQVKKVMKFGVNGYVIKPFTDDKLYKSLDHIIKRIH